MKKKESQEECNWPDNYIVLGADLGLNRPGFALLYVENGKISKLETFCVDNKTKKVDKPRGQILSEIAEKLQSLLSQKPLVLVREASINNASFGRRSGTAARTGISEVVGVTDLIAWQNGYTWHEVYPVSVKKLVTGSGKSDKSQVAQMLNDYVGDHDYFCDDESDATAVALAHLIREGQIEYINKTEERASVN